MNRRAGTVILGPGGLSPGMWPGAAGMMTGTGTETETETGSGYHSEAPSTDSSAAAAAATLAVPVRSGRKGSKKVRTGCITCKIRRVKCDEAKPACLRCTKTGRKCDGYIKAAAANSSEATSSDDKSPAPQPPAARRSALAPSYVPSSYVGWEPSEQRAFHFYRTCSSTSLFRAATRGFWGRVVPGLCFQEPAIRHAALVISDLHERAYYRHHHHHGGGRGGKGWRGAACPDGDRPGYPALSAFAAAHYGRAMRSLQGWTPPREGALAGRASIAVPLLACALFVCVEFMVGNQTVAQMHIQQGRQILASFDEPSSVSSSRAPSPGVELIRQELVPIFTRLSLASFLFGSSPAPIPAALRWTPPATPGAEVRDMAFGSAAEAEQALDELMEDGLRFSREATAWIYTSTQAPDGPEKDAQRARMEAMQAHLLAQLERWHVAAAVLRSTAGPEDADEDEAAAARMSRLYYLTSLVFVRRALARRQTAYDLDTGTFASLVATAGEILDDEERRQRADGENTENDESQRFTFETGVIPPLYFAATRTRHPGLRRAAIAVLRRRAMANCNENLWNARRIVHVAQRTAVMEEERAMQLGFGENEDEAGGGWSYGEQHPDALPQDREAMRCGFASSTQHDEWMALLDSQAVPYRVVPRPSGLSGEDDIAGIVSRVPVSLPPSIPRAQADEVFGAEREPSGRKGTTFNTGSLPPPLPLPPWAVDGGRGLRPPFNIPERARIRNAVISPQVGSGSWVTFFVAPEPGGGPHWGVRREYISAE